MELFKSTESEVRVYSRAFPVIFNRAKNAHLYTEDGKEYLDFQSGQMGAALGHQHPRMVAVIEKTMKSMMHSTNTMLNTPRLNLHERLGKMLPGPLSKSLFLVSDVLHQIPCNLF